MTSCATDTITISLPRLSRRPPQHGGDIDDWKEWVHDLLFWSQVVVTDGRFAQRPIPEISGPCRVVATVRCLDGYFSPERFVDRWQLGIREGLKASRIATDVAEMVVRWERAEPSKTGTDISITVEGQR